jgi:hypothetical protein
MKYAVDMGTDVMTYKPGFFRHSEYDEWGYTDGKMIS